MSRTTPVAVQAVLAGNYDGTTDVGPFMEMAEIMVDSLVDCVTENGDVPLGSKKLEMIERLLSCHFYQMSDQGLMSEVAGRAEGVFKGTTGPGLARSDYGQAAMNMDTTGCLRALDKGAVARAFWGGKTPTERTPYADRQ